MLMLMLMLAKIAVIRYYIIYGPGLCSTHESTAT